MDKLQTLSSPKGNIPSSKLHGTSHLRKITAFWDAAPMYQCCKGTCCHTLDGSNMFICNTGTYLPILWHHIAEESNFVSRIHNNLTDVY